MPNFFRDLSARQALLISLPIRFEIGRERLVEQLGVLSNEARANRQANVAVI